MATVVFSPVGNGFQWLGQTGLVLAGGKINTYLAGSTTPAATYTDKTGTVANANPIILDSTGRYAQEIWLDVSLQPYKFVITDSLGVTQFTLDNLSTLNSAANISFTPLGSGAVSTTDANALQQIVNLSVGWGADPTGVADSTAAFQNALNSLIPTGGVVTLSGTAKFKVGSNLTIPVGVQVVGSFNAAAATQPQGVGPINFTNLGSAILLAPTATITMNASSSIKGCVIYNSSLTYPTAGSGSFSGTAITVAGPDVYVGYSLIVGFTKGVFSSGFERGKYEWLLGDNNTGIEITGAADVPNLSFCHMWPFGSYQFSSFTAKVDNGGGLAGNTLTVVGATTGPALAVGAYVGTVGALITALGTYNSSTGGTCTIGGAAQLVAQEAMTASPFQNFARTGDAYYLHDVVDGPQLDSCFAFGYLNGFHFKNISTAHINGCFADNTLTHAGSSGFLFEGGINTASVVACGAWSSQYGYNFNMNSQQIIHLGNCTSEAVTSYGVFVQAGDARISNCEFINMPTCLFVSTNGSIVNWDQNSYAQISSTPIILNQAGTTVVFIGTGNNWIDGTFGVSQTANTNTALYPLTAAATLALPSWGETFVINGSTGITTITGGHIGRRIRFYFANAPAISNGGGADQPLLNWGATFNAAAGASLSLVHNGFGWVEIGRSFNGGTTSGWGTPVGGAVINNYNITDAGGANSNTNKAVASIIAALKSIGIFTT